MEVVGLSGQVFGSASENPGQLMVCVWLEHLAGAGGESIRQYLLLPPYIAFAELMKRRS